MSPQLVMQSVQAAKFILEHYPPARNWDNPVGSCHWYLTNGFMILARDTEGSLVATVSARPVEYIGDSAVAYKYDRNGDYLAIDLMVAPEMPDALRELLKGLCQVLGPRRGVCYFRYPEQRLHVLKYDRFVRGIPLIGKATEKRK